MCNARVISGDHSRAVQENESNIRTKSSNQDKQFSIESLLGKEICQNICLVSTNSKADSPLRLLEGRCLLILHVLTNSLGRSGRSTSKRHVYSESFFSLLARIITSQIVLQTNDRDG